jgi:hypothetical protein
VGFRPIRLDTAGDIDGIQVQYSHTHLRANHSGGDGLLSGMGLPDEPRLARPRREQRLCDGVVNVVGTDVFGVLAFERSARAAPRRAARIIDGDDCPT